MCVMVVPQKVGPNPEKSGPERWGPEGWGGPEVWGGPKGWGARGVEGRRVGFPKSGVPEGWGGGGEGWEAQNFALFSLSRPQFRSFCLSLSVFSWNFGGVGNATWPQRVWLGQKKNLAPKGDSPRAQLGTFQGPGLQKPPKFHERTPRERRKKDNCGWRGKKERNFGR